MACRALLHQNFPWAEQVVLHRVSFTAVLFSLKGVPDSTPALTLVFVGCPFLQHPLLPGRGARCFPACRTGWRSCAAPCPGGCSPVLFSVQTPCKFITHVGLDCLGTTTLCDPPLKPYAPGETNLDSPCSVGWSNVLSASHYWVTKSLSQVCTESGFGRVQSLQPNTGSTLGPFRCCFIA